MSVIPEKGRLLGIDVGQVRIGLAICDTDRVIASPMETYARRSADIDADYFRTLVRSERIVGLVIGLPISLNDTEGPKARECREYGEWLQSVTNLPVEYHDERFTSALAEEALREAGLSHQRRKARRDRVAAQLILQGWIEARHGS